MAQRRSRGGLKAALLVLMLGMAACSTKSEAAVSGFSGGDDGGAEEDGRVGTTGDGVGNSGGTVTYGLIQPAWIDSFNTQDRHGFEVTRLLYDGLTDYGDDLEAIPAVAISWETDDNITWTFHLRNDVTFHSGRPVTAHSFVDAFTRVADPTQLSDVSYHGSYIARIKGWAEVESGEATEISGVTAIDDFTLQIVLDAPYPVLPKVLAHPVFSPVDLEAVGRRGATYSDQPVGNGPYQMDGPWQHDVAIDLVRFEDYYGERGSPDRIEFKVFDSVETMYLEARAGNLDISDVPPSSIESAQADFADRYLDIAVGSYNYLGMPVNAEPFDDRRIRQALSMAIDRELISHAIFAGTRAPATGFAPPLAPGALEGCQYTDFDPQRARELFDEAGGVPGGTITVHFNAGGGHEEWTEAIGNSWLQTLGVETKFIGHEFAPYLSELHHRELQGPFRLGWLWDAPTTEAFLSPLFLSQSNDNYTGYSSEKFDQAIAEFHEAPTEQAGYPALAAAQEELCKDMPVIPMFFGRGQKVYSDRVENVMYTVFDYVELERVRLIS